MRIVAVVLALACASPAHADPTIYKCERDGRITYSGTPCEGTTVKEFAPSTGSSPHDQAQVRLELELAGAITSGDLPRTTALIANGADVRARDKDGVTPLHRAVAAGRVAIVELLIAKGAETNARSNEGVAPLHVAAMSDRAAVAEILIARGAEINARTRSGYTPLLCAAREGHLGLNVDVKSDQPLHLAAHMGDGELVKQLIDHGADINYARHGETALHAAIAERHREASAVLINSGANVNAVNMSGRTPLHFLAAYIDDGKLAELMVGHGAYVNARDKNGATPLMFATRARNRQVADVLLRNGGN